MNIGDRVKFRTMGGWYNSGIIKDMDEDSYLIEVDKLGYKPPKDVHIPLPYYARVLPCEDIIEDGDTTESKDKDCKEIVSFIMKEKYKRRNENLVVLINKDIERNVKNLIVEWEENYPCLISYNRTLCGLPIVVMEVDDVKVVTFEEYKKRCRSEE